MKSPAILPCLLSILCVTARGNDTSLHNGRYGPEPLDTATGQESPVRMVAEQLEVQFGKRRTTVHCTFTFRNTRKSGTIEQLVGFPDTGAAEAELRRVSLRKGNPDPEIDRSAPLEHLRTWVNGRRVKSELRYGHTRPSDAKDSEGTDWMWDPARESVRAWHTVSVTFPAGQDVTVERQYSVENGWAVGGIAFFGYTTATGGVWKSTIGRLQADVTLRDGITVDDLIWPGTKNFGEVVPANYRMSPGRSGWQVIDRTHLRMVWNDFEPRTQPNRRGFTLAHQLRKR
jgi:hypothetical protein